MKPLQKIGITVVVFSMFSCSTLRNAPDDVALQTLNPDNLNMLDGKYERFGSKRDTDIFRDLFVREYNEDPTDHIVLKVIDARHIEVTLINSDLKAKCEIRKGKIEGNYFVFKRKIRFHPRVITNLFKESSVRIGLLDNGNLTANSRGLVYGTTLFLFPFGEGEKRFGIEHKKLPF